MELVKKQVLDKFNEQKDYTDMSQSISVDGFSFKIQRENGYVLIYDGTMGEFVNKDCPSVPHVKTCSKCEFYENGCSFLDSEGERSIS